VICEVALALALLIAAGLLVRTGWNITHVDLGFEPRGLLAMQLSIDPAQYQSPAAIASFYDRLATTLSGRPGVERVAAGSLVPFGTEGNGAELFFEGQPDPKPAETPSTSLNQVTPGYIETLGLRLRRGRALAASDRADAPRVAMINETLAHRHFSGSDPIGRRVRLGRASVDLWSIVGVVADVKTFEPTDPREPQVYVPHAQSPGRYMTVVIRSAGDPLLLSSSVRAAIATLDPAEPIQDLTTMDRRIKRVTGPYQVVSEFVTFFGAVTLLLAGVGVYGVVSYSFAQRTREIGIRMALGARRADVAALVMRQIRAFLLGGLVPGFLLAWVLANTMEAILFGVTPWDAPLYVGMPLLLTLVSVLAALLPAKRATAIEPVVALRHE
jgi:predicted permease